MGESFFIAVSPGFSCKQSKRLAKELDGVCLNDWTSETITCRSKTDRNQKLTCFRKHERYSTVALNKFKNKYILKMV